MFVKTYMIYQLLNRKSGICIGEKDKYTYHIGQVVCEWKRLCCTRLFSWSYLHHSIRSIKSTRLNTDLNKA